jgi:HSP20 family protein
MANITTYRPADVWSGWDPFESRMDELFRGFFVKPLSLEGRGFTQVTPLPLDVSETEKEYRVVAEMPGVRKEDINVSINNNEVAISAEVKNEKEAKDGERTLRTERFYGKLQRAFTLEHPVDEAKAQARYENGVLELTLPKSEAAMPKRIAVH